MISQAPHIKSNRSLSFLGGEEIQTKGYKWITQGTEESCPLDLPCGSDIVHGKQYLNQEVEPGLGSLG